MYVGFVGHNLGFHEICVKGKFDNVNMISLQSSEPGREVILEYFSVLFFLSLY